jgi:hypothetical protein
MPVDTSKLTSFLNSIFASSFSTVFRAAKPGITRARNDPEPLHFYTTGVPLGTSLMAS